MRLQSERARLDEEEDEPDAPDTPKDEPKPPPVQDPPAEPDPAPYVVRGVNVSGHPSENRS